MTRFSRTNASRINAGNGPFGVGSLNEIYHQWYSRLLAVTTTRYRWLGLGPWIDPMRLEFLLVTRGMCAFTYVNHSQPLPQILTQARTDYYDKQGPSMGDIVPWVPAGPGQPKEIFPDRFTVTQAIVTGYLDDTYTPAGYSTYAPNGAGGIKFNTLQPLKQWKAVPIWGDANRSEYDAFTIAYYAKRLAQAALAVDTDLLNTMLTPMVVGSQDELKTQQIALEGVYAGVPQFVAKNAKGGTLEDVRALAMGVDPRTVEAAVRTMQLIYAEALEALGIESPMAEKPERRISDEVDRNGGHVAAIRRLTLTPRRRAAQLINQRFFEGEPVVEVVDQW